MSGIDVFEVDPVAPPRAARPTGFMENLDAGYRSTRAYGLTNSKWYALKDGYSDIQDQLTKAGMPVRDRFGSVIGAGDVATAAVNPGIGQADRIVADAWRNVSEARKRDPGFLSQYRDRAAFEAAVLKSRQDALADAAEVGAGATTLGSIGQFVGSLKAGFLDPVSYVGLGGLSPHASATRMILMSGARGAAINVAAEAVTQPILFRDAKELGIERTASDVMTDLGVAAVLGFGIDAGTAAAGVAGHKLISRLRKRPDLTPDEADALTVAEAAMEVRQSSPYADAALDVDGVPALATHVETLSDTMRALETGEPLPAPAIVEDAPIRPEVEARAMEAATIALDVADTISPAVRAEVVAAIGMDANPYAGPRGGKPKAPETFATHVRSILKAMSKRDGRPVLIELEDAVSYGVDADLLNMGNRRGLFSSRYGELAAIDELRISLDELGDRIDWQRFGIEPEGDGRLSPQQIADALRTDLEAASLGGERLFAVGEDLDRYRGYRDFEASRYEFEQRFDAGEIDLEDLLSDDGMAELAQRLAALTYREHYPELSDADLARRFGDDDPASRGLSDMVDSADGDQAALRDPDDPARDGRDADAAAADGGARAGETEPPPGREGAGGEGAGVYRADGSAAGGQAGLADFAAAGADTRLAEFDAPGSPAFAEQTALIEHDVLAALADPNIDAVNRQRLQLAADSPMRAKVDQDDVTGLSLFEQDLFAVATEVDADGRVRASERSATDLLADLDADQAAIDALKACLE